MPVAIAYTNVGYIHAASFHSVTLPVPAAAGDLLFVEVVSDGYNPIEHVEVNGNPYPPQKGYSASSAGGQVTWSARIVRCVGGEDLIRVFPTNPYFSYITVLHQLTGEAHINPYLLYVNSDVGPSVAATPPWFAADLGIVFATYFAPKPAVPAATPPPLAGWANYVGLFSPPQLNIYGSTRPITVAGAQASESFTNPTPNWGVALLAFYDLALRLPPAVAYSQVGLSTETAGASERTEIAQVAPDEPGRMPPEPTEIDVPLPPWIAPGPYRHGS